MGGSFFITGFNMYSDRILFRIQGSFARIFNRKSPKNNAPGATYFLLGFVGDFMYLRLDASTMFADEGLNVPKRNLIVVFAPVI